MSTSPTTKLLLFFTAAFFLSPHVPLAQAQCPGGAQATLDANNVRAGLFNSGAFFRRGGGSTGTLHIPKDDGINALYNAHLWFGGTRPNDAPYFNGCVYCGRTYSSGPIDANGNPPNDCTDSDRMYSVYDADIRAYERDGTLTDDLRDWPHHLGAPVVDGDGIDGNYDLAAGDRPHVYGEQSVWWVMNDYGLSNQNDAPTPIGLEVQVQAFSASCLPNYRANEAAVERVNDALSHATYYHFKIIHKGQEALREAYIGWYMTGGLRGTRGSDFVGTDTLLKMMYYYGDAAEGGDGLASPALGALLVKDLAVSFDGRDNDRNGVVDEEGEGLPFTNSKSWFGTGSINGSPFGQEAHYLYLRGLWADKSPLTLGGMGYGGGEPTNYVFPGDPVAGAFWSEANSDNSGPASGGFGLEHDLISSGPFDFAPGDTTTFVLAMPWARSTSRLGSIVKLRQSAGIVRGSVDELMEYDIQSCPAIDTSEPEIEQPDPDALGYYLLRQNYPEPFNQQTTIRYEIIDTIPVQLHVYDVLGRRVRTLVDGMQDAGVYDVVFEAGTLPTGIYFYRLETAGYVSITRRMTLQR